MHTIVYGWYFCSQAFKALSSIFLVTLVLFISPVRGSQQNPGHAPVCPELSCQDPHSHQDLAAHHPHPRSPPPSLPGLAPQYLSDLLHLYKLKFLLLFKASECLGQKHQTQTHCLLSKGARSHFPCFTNWGDLWYQILIKGHLSAWFICM